MQEALARFPRAALPKIANFLRYTSNPSPSRFFRIVVLIVKLFLLLVFFVLLVPRFGMIVVFASGHVVRPIPPLSSFVIKIPMTPRLASGN